MKKNPKSLTAKIIVLISILTVVIIYSCHKELSSNNVNNSNALLQSNNIDIGKLKAAYSNGIGLNTKIKSSDISQQAIENMVGTLNVDWSTYTLQKFADSTEIIEFAMPDDTSLYALGDTTHNDTTYHNKTSAVFILHKDSLTMSFFMKTMESESDSSYVSVINQVHYLQVPTTFNGHILYFTLNRQFINGYGWQKGNIATTISFNQNSQLPVGPQNIKSKNEIAISSSCTTTSVYEYNDSPLVGSNSNTADQQGGTWTLVSSSTECTYSITDDGGGGSGGSSAAGGVSGGGSGSASSGGSTPVNCPTTTVSSLHGKVMASVPGCPVVTPQPVTPPPAPPALVFNTDALNAKYPCAVKLVLNQLLTNPTYISWVKPFLTTKKPDLVWTASSLPWNLPVKNPDGTTSYQYELGTTTPATAGAGLSATITLNTSMLQNSSQLLIAAASIHETLHAYINYGLSIAEYDAQNGSVDFSGNNWLLSIDQWCVISGLPSNFSNHFIMMSSYFDQAVNILKTWDNGAHTTTQYAMAMLYGMNTADASATPTEVADLKTEYSNIKAEYSLTDAQIATFDISQLNSPSSAQLPGNCN